MKYPTTSVSIMCENQLHISIKNIFSLVKKNYYILVIRVQQ